MKTFIYIGIALVSGFLGYKLAQARFLNKTISPNVTPVISSVTAEIKAINEKLSGIVTPEEKLILEAQKQRLIELLSKLYGATVEQIKILF